MKTSVVPNHRQQGNVLVVTLFILSLLGFFLYAYLLTVRTQRSLVTRSQAWNAALGHAEAGAEEALAQLNPGAPAPLIDRSGNGWGAAVGGFYGPTSRSLSNGTYSVVISDDAWPIIYATGYVAVPSIPATLTRTIRVTTTNTALFTAAMATIFNIDLKGNGVTTDSFNSVNSGLSTAGFYDPTKTSTNGDIASVQGIVNVGNGNVNGSVLLGPTASDSISKNGYVTGGVSNDFNVTFENVVVPETNWLPVLPVPLIIDGVTYQYAFPSLPLSTGLPSYYSVSGLSGNVYIGTNQNITLLVSGDANPGTIKITGSGTGAGKLTLYMDGPSFTLSGSDSVDSGNAANFAYYGTTNNTQITFSGNAAFTGTIYAPQADFSLGGGGSGTYDFVGASVTKSVSMNGHFNFHFDENLMAAGPKKGFVAASWTEL